MRLNNNNSFPTETLLTPLWTLQPIAGSTRRNSQNTWLLPGYEQPFSVKVGKVTPFWSVTESSFQITLDGSITKGGRTVSATATTQ